MRKWWIVAFAGVAVEVGLLSGGTHLLTASDGTDSMVEQFAVLAGLVLIAIGAGGVVEYKWFR